MSDALLKLSAADAEDLQVIAAICQDALVPAAATWRSCRTRSASSWP